MVGCADVGGTRGQNNMERVDGLVKGKRMMKPSVALLCQFSKSMVHGIMGRGLRNNFPSGRPKIMSRGPVDHTKKMSRVE